MLYAMFALDKAGGAEARHKVHPDHIKHIKKAAEYGVTIVSGGPLVNDDGSASIGSIMILEAADRSTVERFNGDDPLQAAWGSVEIRRFDKKQ